MVNEDSGYVKELAVRVNNLMYNRNPNESTKVSASLQATELCLYMPTLKHLSIEPPFYQSSVILMC